MNRDTSQPLDPDRSLDSNGVRSGHHLYLRRQVVAGGGPAYNEILKDRLIKSEAIDERFVSTVRDLAKEEFQTSSQRIAIRFLLGTYLLLILSTLSIIFLQGFHYKNFDIDDKFLQWLGGATIGEVAGLLALVYGALFRK